MQEVSAATGFSAQNQRRLHYGLGDATTVERVTIRWPSGQTQTIERPQIDTLHHIKEPDAPLTRRPCGTARRPRPRAGS